MEKINKSNNEKNSRKKRRKNKLKNQISLFTIMLWVFLISTMITITVNSTKNTNALEVEDENWNVSLVMYDRSSDTPNQSITEFTWNAIKENETKQLCMQINYACTTNKGYHPGEIEITIPGISKDSFSEYNRNENSYDYWLRNNITIAADKLTDMTKKYDWSYSYDKENNIYTFINNSIIEENEHFEGTIQIVYNLLPRFRIQTDLEFKVKIRENIKNTEEIIAKESNLCYFHYTTQKITYTLIKNATVAPKKDFTKIEDILDNYYWVSYYFNYISGSGIIRGYGENTNLNTFLTTGVACIKDTLPEGCVVYDKNLEKIKAKENNVYYYLNAVGDNYYYIGYPKEKYSEGDIITNTAELWGRYEDEDITNLEKLSDASVTINLVDFDFEYKGDLYSIDKGSSIGFYENEAKNGVGRINWILEVKAFYTDSVMDVEIGDDLLYISRENGKEIKLNDDEYNFIEVQIPIFYTYNKYSGSNGDKLIGYNYEVQVRYKNTNEYIVYKEGITKDTSETTKLDRDDIVGVKIVIKDLNKTLYSGRISVKTKINTKDCRALNNGRIYNFSYLQVYKKDEKGNRVLVNEPTLDSYKTPSTIKNVAEFDIQTYGTYMQRAFVSSPIDIGSFDLVIRKDNSILNNNVKDEKYELSYKLTSTLNLYYFEVNKGCVIKQYDILPLGINLASSKEEIINSIYIERDFPYQNLKLKDGSVFDTREDLKKYIENNTTVDIDYNYKDSGRTKISIIYNLNEIDWSYYLVNRFGYDIDVNIRVEIPYDSILEYGTSYKNYAYIMWNNQEYGYRRNSSIIDNGKYDPLASDIDNDGDTTEKVGYVSNNLNISHGVSSQQAVIKQVRTDLTKGKFVEETAEATAGSEYTYKLRVTTGANSLKDLILYDTLETIYDEEGNDISSGWNGKFLGLDTTYAESKGYAPKVYYSEEKNPGKLTEVPDKWKELTDDVDKATVKSICVDLRYKADGTEMELSANNVVFVLINMQAPEDDTLLTSANNMFSTNWRAIDPLGTVIDNVEGIYSNQVNVEIHKDDIRTNISGSKTWNDLDNKYEQRKTSIKVKLLQDGQEYETKEVTEDDNWNYTFENIPVYASNTRKYEYEIVEDEVQNYETTYDGYNITNSIRLKDIEVTKVWEDNNNEAQKRPSSIILQVFDSDKLITEAEVNEESEWKHTFTNLLKYREDGTEINYIVDEKELDEEVSKFYVKNIVGNVITNKFVVPEDRVKIVGTKVWNDSGNAGGKRDTNVILQLKSGENIIAEAEVSDKNNWSYEFEAPKYDELGNEIDYYIDERNSDNKFYKKILTDKNTVTNEFIVPEEVILVKAVKKWEDNNDEYGKRPENVILQVFDGDKLIAEEKVSADNNWSYEFKLPKYDELGDEIRYTVDEKSTSKYYEKSVEGYTVINKCVYEPLVDTSDMNIIVYVVIFFVAIIGLIVGISFIKKKHK